MLHVQYTRARRGPDAHQIRVGDIARFPASRLGNADIHNRTWEVIAFTADGLIVMRRRHDGLQKTITPRWWRSYADLTWLEERSAESCFARRQGKQEPSDWQVTCELVALMRKIEDEANHRTLDQSAYARLVMHKMNLSYEWVARERARRTLSD